MKTATLCVRSLRWNRKERQRRKKKKEKCQIGWSNKHTQSSSRTHSHTHTLHKRKTQFECTDSAFLSNSFYAALRSEPSYAITGPSKMYAIVFSEHRSFPLNFTHTINTSFFFILMATFFVSTFHISIEPNRTKFTFTYLWHVGNSTFGGKCKWLKSN